MNKKYAGIIVGIAVALASAPTYAQLGGLANSFLGGKESGGKSVTAESIVEKYVDGSKDVMAADVHFLNALGLKEQAAKEEADAAKIKAIIAEFLAQQKAGEAAQNSKEPSDSEENQG